MRRIGSSRHRRDLPAPAPPDRHGSPHQHPPDRVIRHAQVLTQLVQRPPVPIQDDRFLDLRLGHDRPNLARTSNVLCDRRAMKPIDLGQLTDTSGTSQVSSYS
jgi:hypothetical protein